MSKIIITEGDIRNMVLKTVTRLLNEEVGTSSAYLYWYPFSEFDEYCEENGLTEEYGRQLVAQGIVPAELVEKECFTIIASCDTRRGFDNDTGPWSDNGEVSYGGDYDEARQLIGQVKDENVKQILTNSLDMLTEPDTFEYTDFERLEKDDLFEGINEHDPDDPDYGQVGDWHVEQGQKRLANGGRFDSLEEFVSVAKNCELPLKAFEAYLTHSDIGLLDRGISLTFYPSSISFEAPDKSVGVTFGGWIVEDIDWEYGENEKCQYEGKIVRLEQGMIDWLDKEVAKWLEANYRTIEDKLYQ